MEKKTPHFVETSNAPSLWIQGYEVCFDPVESCYLQDFSVSQKQEYVELLQESQIQPKQCLDKALTLKNKCPPSPLMDNLVCFLYVNNHKIKEAEQFIEDTFHGYPDYFFAKINYADQLLRTKKYDEIIQIFPSDELKDNCHNRMKFHVIEYRSFMSLMSRYYLCIGDKEKALMFYQNAYQADPAHPSLLKIEKALYGSRMVRWFKKTSKTFLNRLTLST